MILFTLLMGCIIFMAIIAVVVLLAGGAAIIIPMADIIVAFGIIWGIIHLARKRKKK